MSFSTLIILAFILLIVFEIYFTKKQSNIVKTLFPSVEKRKIRIAILFTSILFFLYPISGLSAYIYSNISGVGLVAPQNGWFDLFFVYPFWASFLIVAQAVIILLPFEMLRWLLYPMYKNQKDSIKKYYTYFSMIIILLSVIYVPIRIYYDHNYIETRDVDFYKENLPDELKGLKIVLISDVQADRYTNENRLNKFIDAVNDTDPDIILIAGDLITNTPNYIKFSAEKLSRLKSKYGVYSCIGDHDNWAYGRLYRKSINEITEALRLVGIPLVDNDHKCIKIGESKINITFVTNTYAGRISQTRLTELANGDTEYSLKIFLTHQPREHLINAAKDNNYDMYLCGHTHGGQITILFPFMPLSPTLLETTFVKGDFWFDDMLMIVSRGWGMSIAPIRYNSTPEITVITLNDKGNSKKTTIARMSN